MNEDTPEVIRERVGIYTLNGKAGACAVVPAVNTDGRYFGPGDPEGYTSRGWLIVDRFQAPVPVRVGYETDQYGNERDKFELRDCPMLVVVQPIDDTIGRLRGTVNMLEQGLREAREKLSKAESDVATLMKSVEKLQESNKEQSKWTGEWRERAEKARRDAAGASATIRDLQAKLDAISDEIGQAEVRRILKSKETE